MTSVIQSHDSGCSSVTSTQHSSLSGFDPSADLLLEEFLGRRGLDRSALDLVGARWEPDHGRLLYPRLGRGEGDVLPQGNVEIVGWKVRDLNRDVHFNAPPGIPAGLTWPLLVRGVLPASGLFICEGETDTMRLSMSDIPQWSSSDVMCVPGTNAFQDAWIPFIRTYERIVVLADGDDAGMNLPNKVASLVPGARCAQLPPGHDVCSFLLAHPQDDLWALIQSAPLHLVKQAIKRTNWDWHDAASSDHRDKLLRVVSKDVHLTKRSSDEFVGKCPFHEEKTASFFVNARKGLYRCWGCNARGDVITYLKATRDIDFKEAIRVLEEIR